MKAIKQRTFRCLACGCIRQAPKKRQTGIGHIKTMFCPVCKGIRDFEQIRDNERGIKTNGTKGVGNYVRNRKR